MMNRLLQGLLVGALLAGCGPTEQAELESAETATTDDELRKKNPCHMVKCWAGTHCEPQPGGGSACVPDVDPCATVRCAAGTHCEAQPDGTAACLPDYNPCWAVKCASGTHCEVQADGTAACLPDVNPCATVRCGFGTTCVVIGGQAVCQ